MNIRIGLLPFCLLLQVAAKGESNIINLPSSPLTQNDVENGLKKLSENYQNLERRINAVNEIVEQISDLHIEASDLAHAVKNEKANRKMAHRGVIEGAKRQIEELNTKIQLLEQGTKSLSVYCDKAIRKSTK